MTIYKLLCNFAYLPKHTYILKWIKNPTLKARLLWQLIFALFSIQWVLSCLVREVLLSWHGSFVGKNMKKAWKAAPLYIFWVLWWDRNRRAFDNFESTDQTIKNSFLYIFWDWVRLYIEGGSLSLLDFMDSVGSW